MEEKTGIPDYSLVIPIFNEESTLPALVQRVGAVLDELDGPAEVILVDDGSRDGSWDLILQARDHDPRFKAVGLSRNFGHQIAVSAGLDHARGRAAVTLDADLQDPPELIPELAARWREGYDVVYAVRDQREAESRFKRLSAKLFYRLLRRLTETDIPREAGDFRLADRKVVDAVRGMPERSRFLRGLFAWAGYRQIGVHYTRQARFAGESKYPVRKMFRFATDGVVNFSNVPLRLALNVGFLVSAVAIAAGFAAIVAKAFGAFTVPGWASLLVVTSFMGGIQLIVIGVMGEYVGRIYEEVKRRPLYLVRETHGAAPDEPQGVPQLQNRTAIRG
jgi:glycosyltransferase involved in cell wall biosynthesis